MNGFFTFAGKPPIERQPPANHAADLNRALSALHAAQGTYSQADFQKNILPMYQRLIAALEPLLSRDDAEKAVIALMDHTTQACHRASRTLLPAGRLGTDYRQVEIDYTDALVTAMAVDCLLNARGDRADSPEAMATRLIPEAVLNRLRADPRVWEDWLGFFVQSPTGGLYAVTLEQTVDALSTKPIKAVFNPKKGQSSNSEKHKKRKENSVAKGWQVVEGIKNGLADGSLSFNQLGDCVQVDAQGRTFLQTPAVFEAVKRLHSWEEGARTLENRFLRLNIHRTAPGGWQRFRGKSLRSETLVRGYVIDDSSLFWESQAPHGRFLVQGVTGRE